MSALHNIVSLRVGMPEDYGTPGAPDPLDRPWHSGIFKEEVNGPVFLGPTGFDGDGQADLRHHGGPDKAVCMYPASRYPYWSRRLERAMPHGGFGENCTVIGVDERDVCIGDRYRLDEAVVEVSQPRSSCWKLARRWREPQLALWVQQTGFSGWYLRVLEEGNVAPGTAMTLLERPYPQWTILRANEVRYTRPPEHAQAAELAACPPLGESWQRALRKIADGNADLDESKRLIGTNVDNVE